MPACVAQGLWVLDTADWLNIDFALAHLHIKTRPNVSSPRRFVIFYWSHECRIASQWWFFYGWQFAEIVKTVLHDKKVNTFKWDEFMPIKQGCCVYFSLLFWHFFDLEETHPETVTAYFNNSILSAMKTWSQVTSSTALPHLRQPQTLLFFNFQFILQNYLRILILTHLNTFALK